MSIDWNICYAAVVANLRIDSMAVDCFSNYKPGKDSKMRPNLQMSNWRWRLKNFHSYFQTLKGYGNVSYDVKCLIRCCLSDNQIS